MKKKTVIGILCGVGAVVLVLLIVLFASLLGKQTEGGEGTGSSAVTDAVTTAGTPAFDPMSLQVEDKVFVIPSTDEETGYCNYSVYTCEGDAVTEMRMYMDCGDMNQATAKLSIYKTLIDTKGEASDYKMATVQDKYLVLTFNPAYYADQTKATVKGLWELVQNVFAQDSSAITQ